MQRSSRKTKLNKANNSNFDHIQNNPTKMENRNRMEILKHYYSKVFKKYTYATCTFV